MIMENTKSIVTAIVIGIALIVSSVVVGTSFPSQPASDRVATVENDTDLAGQRAGLQEFINGIYLGNKDSHAGENVEWYTNSIPVGSDSVKLFTNDTGKTLFADFGAFENSSGTASSSYKVNLFATTSTSVPASHWDVAVVATSTGLLRNITIATSTTATTTNSVQAAALGAGNGGVIIPPNWSVFGFIQPFNAIAGVVAGQGEFATSSLRGFAPNFTVRIHYPK